MFSELKVLSECDHEEIISNKEQQTNQLTELLDVKNPYKCGEILLLNEHFLINCLYCNEIHHCFETFTQHLYDSHLRIEEKQHFPCDETTTMLEEVVDAASTTCSINYQTIKIETNDMSFQDNFHNYCKDIQINTTGCDDNHIVAVAYKEEEPNNLIKEEEEEQPESTVDSENYLIYNPQIEHLAKPQDTITIANKPIRKKLPTHNTNSKITLNNQKIYTSNSKKPSMYSSLITAASTKCDGSFKCPICGRFYNRFDSLKIHYRSHTGELNPYQCTDCNKTFTAPCKLEIHKRVHSGERPYSCHICPQAFKAKQKLNNHLESHKKGTIKIHKTIIEGISKQERQPARLPILIENKFVTSLDAKKEDGLYHCPVCDRSYRRFESLKEHSENHIDAKQYECYHCKKRFHKLRTLKAHIKSHLPNTDTRWKSTGAITCDYCEKTFNNKYYLNEHLNGIHFGKKPYKCEVCLREFGFKNNYVLHMRIHVNDKRYQCNYCDMRFVQSCSKVRHERIVHLNKKELQQDDTNIEKYNESFQSDGEDSSYAYDQVNATPTMLPKNQNDCYGQQFLEIKPVNLRCLDCGLIFDEQDLYDLHIQEHENTANFIVEYIEEEVESY